MLHANLIGESGPGRALFLCGFGLLLGMRHATDADHLVALSTIVSRQRSVKRAALIGSMWGVGHTVTIFLVGSLIILFHLHIPVRLGLSMEFGVAVMLVVLGLLNLTGWMRRVNAFLRGSAARTHWHSDEHSMDEHVSPKGMAPYLRSLVIGLVHGLAGSAAVALLVLSTIPDPVWATLYLLIFGVGTIAGMVLMTTAIALPLTYGSRRFQRLNSQLALTSGAVSLCFGLFLIYQLGFVGGLFTGHPHWTPQ